MKTFFLALAFCISYVGAWAGLAGWEDVSQTIERDRVMSEAWHRINNEDAHLSYAQSCRDSWVATEHGLIDVCPIVGKEADYVTRDWGTDGDALKDDVVHLEPVQEHQ